MMWFIARDAKRITAINACFGAAVPMIQVRVRVLVLVGSSSLNFFLTYIC
jgi:hypothetical protein